MTRQLLKLAILFACFGICGIGPFVFLLREPPPEVVQQNGSTLSVVCQAASTDPSLEIQWYQFTAEGLKLPVDNSSSTVQGLLFKIESVVLLKTNILTIVTSTLTIERLSLAYAGAYACSAVAGDLTVDSDAFQVQISGTTMNSTLPATDGCATDQD